MVFSKDKALRYEEWFVNNNHIFGSEVETIRSLITPYRKGIEIGVGTGLFASSFGILNGIEPCKYMAQKAIERGINVINGYAEYLPFPDNNFDFVLMVTVDCFLSDLQKAFHEINRILMCEGFFIIAFLDKSTTLGNIYQEKKASNEFYKGANFHAGNEIKDMLLKTDFNIVDMKQTVFNLQNEPQLIKDNIGEGLFAVIRAEKRLST
ncbi:MAG TPA: class I SAM-dependent methyltransferase [Petrimonas sp.]|uniref:class I SAM-dependent methyltransferase n=1 Tax=Petrimonas sp. TaxID=2023866 RepID=UPI001763E247|nr:class I SAM-dependent methyltransferase [Petrimonas sp.]